MPFRLPWPFGGRRRRQRPPPAPAASTPDKQAAAPVATPITEAPTLVQLIRADAPQPRRAQTAAITGAPEPSRPVAPDGPDLGQEMLARLPALSTPPTLGRMGGLPTMAQALPAVERFLNALPVPPPSPGLPGLGETAQFAANLPSLAGFTEPGRAAQAPAFPPQLEPPSEPTDVLAPPGGMPGQVAGLSGAAAVLEPSRPPAAQPVVAATPAATASETPGTAALPQLTAEATHAPSVLPVNAAATAAPVSAAPPGYHAAAVWSPQPGPMTRVLPPELTLAGNVLPNEAFAPIQREVRLASRSDWAAPEEFVRPAAPSDEHVSREQRDSIERQRGQGQPLEPETRQRFEQAYGQPLDDVRIHTGAAAHATAQSLNAIAFASGADLFFTQNTFQLDSPPGLSLLGHELAHVIQQQYGVPGDADALRPPDDPYERQADHFAARALDTPLLQTPLTGRTQADQLPVQRTATAEPAGVGSPLVLPTGSTWAPAEQLRTASESSDLAQPLAARLPLTPKMPEEIPIQRVMVGTSAPAHPEAALDAAGTANALDAGPATLPALVQTPERAAGLTEQLLSPAQMLSNAFGLAQNLPGVGRVDDDGALLPVFRSINRGLPGLGSLPEPAHSLPSLSSAHLPDASVLTNQMSNLPSLAAGLPGLGSSAPDMPDLGSVAQSLGSQLPPTPTLPSGLPSLDGLTSPAMPLAEGLGAAGQAVGEAAQGAMAAGQQALGSIASMAPSGGDTPAAPALPSLDKLTEHIWKEVQRKLKVERERSRGLA